MTEKQIIQSWKANGRQFENVSAEEQAWARAHWTDMEHGNRSHPIPMRGDYFVESCIHFLRADYSEPADGFVAAECELADQAVLLGRAKNNLYPLWALRKHDPDLAKLIESVPANEVVYRDDDGVWVRSTGGAAINNWHYRIHKDWQPKPVKEPEAIPEPPVIPGHRLATITHHTPGRWYFEHNNGWVGLHKASHYGACGYLVWNAVEKRWVQWYLTFAYVMPWGVMSPTGGVGETLVYASYVMFPEGK